MCMILVGLVSCVPSKKMIYLQGADELSETPQTIAQNYELKIVPDDQLLITVSSKDEELLELFANSQVLGSSESSSIQETVGLRVDKQGKISDIQVLRGVTPELDQAAIDVMCTLPDWKPGMQDGKPVNVKYTMPIVFKLS